MKINHIICVKHIAVIRSGGLTWLCPNVRNRLNNTSKVWLEQFSLFMSKVIIAPEGENEDPLQRCSLSWKAFIVLHSVVGMKIMTGIVELRMKTEKFKAPRPLPHLHTAAQTNHCNGCKCQIVESYRDCRPQIPLSSSTGKGCGGSQPFTKHY